MSFRYGLIPNQLRKYGKFCRLSQFNTVECPYYTRKAVSVVTLKGNSTLHKDVMRSAVQPGQGEESMIRYFTLTTGLVGIVALVSAAFGVPDFLDERHGLRLELDWT